MATRRLAGAALSPVLGLAAGALPVHRCERQRRASSLLRRCRMASPNRTGLDPSRLRTGTMLGDSPPTLFAVSIGVLETCPDSGREGVIMEAWGAFLAG